MNKTRNNYENKNVTIKMIFSFQYKLCHWNICKPFDQKDTILLLHTQNRIKLEFSCIMANIVFSTIIKRVHLGDTQISLGRGNRNFLWVGWGWVGMGTWVIRLGMGTERESSEGNCYRGKGHFQWAEAWLMEISLGVYWENLSLDSQQ